MSIDCNKVMSKIGLVEKELSVLRTQLREHNLYRSLNDIKDIRIFMQEHVFAVWDFMTLLKALQQKLTCTSLPWIPVVNSKTARFINEIVLEEETDLDKSGEYKSHFEMYVDAMHQIKANTKLISSFISKVIDGEEITKVIESLDIAEETKEFVLFTVEVIKTKEPHIIASSFTFGREDVIPDMFLEIVKNTEEKENIDYSKLSYYLNRHIELDGDEHGPLSLQMIEELCGDDEQKWNDVIYYAKTSLEKRVNLWSGIVKKLSIRN